MMKKRNFKFLLILLALIFISPQASYPATCQEECQVPKSCKEYVECMANHLQCLAACREREAWEISAKASEKQSEALERMIEVLKDVSMISQRTVELLEKMIKKMDRDIPPPAPAPAPRE